MLWFLRILAHLVLYVTDPRARNSPKTALDKDLEIALLRQQLLALQRKHPKPKVGLWFRVTWAMICGRWPRWKEACVLVKPETVVAWHRAGFKLFWKAKSHKRGGRRDRAELIALIRRMAAENPTWGAPRIHGELQKLGLRVSERTVSRFMPKRSRTGTDLEKQRQNWKTFLENHKEVIAAMDFLVVPTWNFKPLYILVILDHGRRIVRHFNVTAHPSAEWVKQQLREAFPFDEIPRYLIHDRDQTLRPLKAFLQAMGIQPKLTAYHCPWQNGDTSYCTSMGRFEWIRLSGCA